MKSLFILTAAIICYISCVKNQKENKQINATQKEQIFSNNTQELKSSQTTNNIPLKNDELSKEKMLLNKYLKEQQLAQRYLDALYAQYRKGDKEELEKQTKNYRDYL